MANEIDLLKVCLPVFGVTRGRWYQLAKDGIVPASVNGKIDFVKAVTAYIAYQRKLLQGSGSLSLTDERTRETRFRADLLEREIADASGKSLPYDQVRADWLRLVGVVRNRLLGIGTEYAPLLFGRTMPEIQTRVDEAIYRALADLSKWEYKEPEKAEVKKKTKKRRGKRDR